jgi:hypothetical protein
VLGEVPFIAMKDVDAIVPDTEIEVALYAAFCHGLGEWRELDAGERAALAAALDAFRGAYHRDWVGGTAFLTRSELVFIPALAQDAGRPTDLALRVPLTGILDVAAARAPWRDTLTVRTVKGRFDLRGFMARRFGARLQRACVDRLSQFSGGSMRPQPA